LVYDPRSPVTFPLSLHDALPIWVVHAGLQDVDLIRQAIGASSPRSLFDTQVGWALSTAESNVSLAYLKFLMLGVREDKAHQADEDRKSTRLNSSHVKISYAVFCL